MPSSRFIEAITAQNTDHAPIALITIEHAGLDAPLRYCTGGAPIVQAEGTEDEVTFEPMAMRVQAPGEGNESAVRRARLTLDNIDQSIIGQLRGLTRPRPVVRIDVVLAEFPDDIEQTWPGLQLTSFRPSGDAIECDLTPRDDSEEEWPVQSYSPGRVKGLF